MNHLTIQRPCIPAQNARYPAEVSSIDTTWKPRRRQSRNVFEFFRKDVWVAVFTLKLIPRHIPIQDSLVSP